MLVSIIVAARVGHEYSAIFPDPVYLAPIGRHQMLCGENVRRVAKRHNAPVEEHHPVKSLCRQIEVVGGHQNRHTVGPQTRQDLKHAFLAWHIQTGKGFIEEQ
jgi:hypothetical protein